jgi:hypothetical protein
MSTGDQKVSLYEKQNLGQQDLLTYWFNYQDTKLNDVVSYTFLSAGILSTQPITLSSVSNDTFRAVLTNANTGVDDDGHIMDLSNLSVAWYQEIAFENSNAIPYYVGFRYQSVPSEAEPNPRSAEAEYSLYKDLIGELGDPDSVTDNTTYIRLVLDGILEAGVDHSGRLVRVYLDNPVSPDSSIAFYDGTVVYSTNNYVDIPYTAIAGPLGQTAPDFPISTTASDYTVHVKGLSWFRNTDIRTDGNYAFIGITTGNGPAATPVSFDISDQVLTLFNSLDNAYRGGSTATPAAGRNISVDKWAVELSQSASAQRGSDIGNAIMRFNKIGETIDGGAHTMKFHPDGVWAIGDIELENLTDGGPDLLAEESVTLGVGTNVVTFTGGTVDLTTFNDWLNSNLFFVWITGTTNSAQDGLYIGSPPASSTTIAVLNLDTGTPVFVAAGASVKARIFIPANYSILDDPYVPVSVSNLALRLESNESTRIGKDILTYGTIDGTIPYVRYRSSDGGTTKLNSWYDICPGKIRARGGGSLNSEYDAEDKVVGSAMYVIDKMSISELHTTLEPDETTYEWGYDYRGADFSKGSNTPSYQLSQTLRYPMFNEVTNDLFQEENFTRVNGTTLQLTRVGADSTTSIPAIPSGFPFYGWVLAEVEYTPSNSSDGV